MSERGWTPGLWELGSNDVGGWMVTVTEAGNECVLAARNDWPHRASESIANAHLIAAAPELFDALHTMTEVYWGVDNDRNGDGGSPPPDCIVKARAALAKALGSPQ